MKKKGFTLVELLVVIAIIALLMAILMPALAKVKKEAKAVACMSNVRQWASIFSMYTSDNNGRFWYGEVERITDTKADKQNQWWGALYPYYKNPELLKCSLGTTWNVRPDVQDIEQFPNIRDLAGEGASKVTITGGFGINAWITNPYIEGSTAKPIPNDYFRTSNRKNTSDIPVFSDSWTVRIEPKGGSSIGTPNMPANTYAQGKGSKGLRSIQMKRHRKGIQMAFMDWSARWVGLKTLWNYNWNKRWNPDKDLPFTKADFKWNEVGDGWWKDL
jgi:prepilin-type N-terminal cleavage/methylation domain-containing protein